MKQAGRFTVSRHTVNRQDHFDVMLERGDFLKTWRVSSNDFSRPRQAEQNFDHRKIYLDYEGNISGNRGTIAIWDTGRYEAVEWNERRIVVRLQGKKLAGVLAFILTDRVGGENSIWIISPLGGFPSRHS